jgi:hypothetical protein
MLAYEELRIIDRVRRRSRKIIIHDRYGNGRLAAKGDTGARRIT